jgi:hypothetical protein
VLNCLSGTGIARRRAVQAPPVTVTVTVAGRGAGAPARAGPGTAGAHANCRTAPPQAARPPTVSGNTGTVSGAAAS